MTMNSISDLYYILYLDRIESTLGPNQYKCGQVSGGDYASSLDDGRAPSGAQATELEDTSNDASAQYDVADGRHPVGIMGRSQPSPHKVGWRLV